MGRESLVSIVTRYGWAVQGSNPGGSEIFRTLPDRPWGPPSLLYNGYRVFPEGKERPGRDADHSPPSSAVVMKGQSYSSTLPMGRTACTEPQCLYKGALYLYHGRSRTGGQPCCLHYGSHRFTSLSGRHIPRLGWIASFPSIPPGKCGDRSFGHFSKNCEKRVSASLCVLFRLSLYPSAWNNMAPTEQIFMKFDI